MKDTIKEMLLRFCKYNFFNYIAFLIICIFFCLSVIWNRGLTIYIIDFLCAAAQVPFMIKGYNIWKREKDGEIK